MIRIVYLCAYGALAALGEALVARPALVWVQSQGIFHTALAREVPYGALLAVAAAALALFTLWLASRTAVDRTGIHLDRSEFKPHLTVMRMREGWPPLSIELFHKALREFRSEPFPVDGVTLYSSELNPKGAIHTPLRRLALAM